jgi:hypothetical protein
LFSGSRSAEQNLVGKLDEIGTETGDGDFASGGILQALSKFGRRFAVTTRELPEMADGGFSGSGNFFPAAGSSVCEPVAQMVIHKESPET